MNLHRRCIKCYNFFPSKPLELDFVCDKEICQEHLNEYYIHKIKKARHINADYFDLYDLDRPILTDGGKVLRYERVCRTCGSPLFNKDGKYSHHRRYCGEHNGTALWEKYTWDSVSKAYSREVANNYKKMIEGKLESFENKDKIVKNVVVCEECFKLCLRYDSYWMYGVLKNLKLKVINIHHKIPIHTLTLTNIDLIWDKNNLIALCKDCHNKQDHQLKRKEIIEPYKDYRKLTEFV